MKSKKILILALVVTVLMTSFTGCASSNSSKSSSNGDKTVVTFWTLSTRQVAIDKMVAAFNKANSNIIVKPSYYDTDGIKNATKVAATSGTLPNMWFNWGGSLGDYYADNGVTYDLTQYAKDNNWSKTYTKAALNLCTFNGKIAGLPTSYNAIGVYYRKDIFKKYNISIPTTFDEFEAVCATLKKNGVTPISTAGLNGWDVMRFVELLVEHYCGADLHDKLNKFQVSWDNAKVVQALTTYKEFCTKGYFPAGFDTADPNDTKTALETGACAMDIQGQWYDGTLLQDKQNLDKYGVFAMPTGGTNRLSSFVEMTQFNKNDSVKEIDACMKFMNYYYNNENISTYAQYYNLPLPKLGASMPVGQPNVKLVLDDSNKNGTFTITDQEFPPEVATGLFNVQDAIATGQMTPAQGAKAIQTAITKYKNK